MRLTMIAFWIPIIAILNIDHLDTHLNLKKKKKQKPCEGQSPPFYRCGNSIDFKKLTRSHTAGQPQNPHSGQDCPQLPLLRNQGLEL